MHPAELLRTVPSTERLVAAMENVDPDGHERRQGMRRKRRGRRRSSTADEIQLEAAAALEEVNADKSLTAMERKMKGRAIRARMRRAARNVAAAADADEEERDLFGAFLDKDLERRRQQKASFKPERP